MPATSVTLDAVLKDIRKVFWSKSYHNVSTKPGIRIVRAFDVEDATEEVLNELTRHTATLGPLLAEMLFHGYPAGVDDYIEGRTLAAQATQMMIGSIAAHMRATDPNVVAEELGRNLQYPL